MDQVVVEWFRIVPGWVINTISIILIILVIGITVFVWQGVQRYSQAMGRENRLISLQERVAELENDARIYKSKSLQLQNVTINTRSFINSLNKLIGNEQRDYYSLIQRIVEAVASDIKGSGSERHRCGYWNYNTNIKKLVLSNGSAGFPESYIGERELGIDESIAGRAFRKQQTLNLSDVTIDGDWSASDSAGTYKALICIPIDSFGVLTIDAREPMDESVQNIGELYASIIEGAFYELIRDISRQDDLGQSAE
ncbi:hypothetical protein AUC31_00090 [Planococcus rifietoensis]|uniref:GAF domain-containing protein n=1 Tax=Planococcus rifietoensis TaxID=200991 RepID=A0A0U2Z1I1_9BACL|nr:GAF domain-containing protein [Planococcus rifietoensis]ALS73739.1 hypothetical protein AUC31_00090 [Planococcus rifietoensis]